jgi:hypothetical protein
MNICRIVIPLLFVALLPEPADCTETAAVTAQQRPGEADKAEFAARPEAYHGALSDGQRQGNTRKEASDVFSGAGKSDGKGGVTVKRSGRYAGFPCELSISYPQGLSRPADDAVRRTALAMLDETVASCEKAAAEHVAEAPGDTSEPLWESITDYTLFPPSTRYVSVLFSTYTYAGGAHPNHTLTARTYDPASGRELTLDDLFPGKVPVDALARLIVENVLKQKKARDSVIGDEKNNVDPTMDRILLTPAGIRIVYAPYEMGSYAEGTYVVDIPKQALKKLGADPTLWR